MVLDVCSYTVATDLIAMRHTCPLSWLKWYLLPYIIILKHWITRVALMSGCIISIIDVNKIPHTQVCQLRTATTVLMINAAFAMMTD